MNGAAQPLLNFLSLSLHRDSHDLSLSVAQLLTVTFSSSRTGSFITFRNLIITRIAMTVIPDIGPAVFQKYVEV